MLLKKIKTKLPPSEYLRDQDPFGLDRRPVLAEGPQMGSVPRFQS
jgi:hypothetical protein